MSSTDDLERVEITSSEELRHWLRENHTQTESIWLVTYKKAITQKYVSWSDVVDEVLCFGWIDSVARKLDRERSMVLLSPRSSASAWSKINKEKAEKLEKAGRMTEAGRRKISDAKLNGSWSFLDDVEALIIPDDLAIAFAEHKGAESNFRAYAPSLQRSILEWIKLAKRSETRANRIVKTTNMAASGLSGKFPPK